MALHRRNIEAHLARLVEDTAANRTALADEIRGEIRLLARTIALARAPAQRRNSRQVTDGRHLPSPRGRRLHLAGLCRRADHAPDGADLPAVDLQRGAVHPLDACCRAARRRSIRSTGRSATWSASSRSRSARPRIWQKDVARLTLLSRKLQAEREKLTADVTSAQRRRDRLAGDAEGRHAADRGQDLRRPPTCRRRSSARSSSSPGWRRRSRRPTTRRASCSPTSPRSRSRPPSRRQRWCG